MPRRKQSADEIAAFRARVCAAATRLFAAKGPENVTMRQIAAEIGVSTMTSYRYFRDKDEVLAMVRAEAFTRLAEQLEAAMRTAGDARERASAVSRAYVAFAEDNPAAYQLMFESTQPNAHYPELNEANARARETMFDYVRGLIAEGLVEGDPVLIGTIFWAAMHGILVLNAAGALAREIDAATLRAEMFSTLFAGLAARAGKRQPQPDA